MKSRFTKHHKTVLIALCVVPSCLLSMHFEECKSAMTELVKLYEGDFLSVASVSAELHCWRTKWKRFAEEHGQDSLPVNAMQSLPHTTQMFPNIRLALRILCTLPVTSCSSERSHSALKEIKDAHRSTMGYERLAGLTLLYVHRDIAVNVDAIMMSLPGSIHNACS